MESTTSLNYSAKEFFYDNSFKDYDVIKPSLMDYLIDWKMGNREIRFAPMQNDAVQQYQSIGRYYRYTKEQAERIAVQTHANLHDAQEMLMRDLKVHKIMINSVYGISHRYEVEIVRENNDVDLRMGSGPSAVQLERAAQAMRELANNLPEIIMQDFDFNFDE